MRAVILPTVNQSLTGKVPSPVLKAGQARISAAGWNKRDHWITKGKYRYQNASRTWIRWMWCGDGVSR